MLGKSSDKNTKKINNQKLFLNEPLQLQVLSDVLLLFSISGQVSGNEPQCEKTGLQDFRPRLTPIRLYSHREVLEA